MTGNGRLWFGLVVLLTAAGCAQRTLAPVYYGSSPSYRSAEPLRVDRFGPGQAVIVGFGDTLYSIARRAGVDQNALIAANGLVPPYLLRPGDRLVLPGPNQHEVRPGETLYGIARSYGVDPMAVASSNGLSSPYHLRPGQKLALPAVAGRPGAAPAAGGQGVSAVASARPIGFIWPARGRVISTFGPKANGLRNDGINISVTEGDPVYAAQSGVVKYAGQGVPQYGNLILIEHDGRWISAYGHNRNVFVKPGDRVERGDRIALAGRSGTVASPQVHFELRQNGKPIDPGAVLGR